jgi:oxalate---CoA ligase
LCGAVGREIFQDAVASVEEILIQRDEWIEWSFCASDGDTAGLLQLISENLVDFKIDTEGTRSSRASLDWNSKKADDDNIETAIQVRVSNRYLSKPVPTLEASPLQEPVDFDEDRADNTKHGSLIDGAPACCRREMIGGVVDCRACLDEQWNSVNASLVEEEQRKAEHLLSSVGQAGHAGLKKDALMVRAVLQIHDWLGAYDTEFQTTCRMTMEELYPIIRKMTNAAIPLVYWMGYGPELSLVSSCHLVKWTLTISDSPLTRIFAKRWLDITGTKIGDVWESAVRAVVNSIVFRPGISQVRHSRRKMVKLIDVFCTG